MLVVFWGFYHCFFEGSYSLWIFVEVKWLFLKIMTIDLYKKIYNLLKFTFIQFSITGKKEKNTKLHPIVLKGCMDVNKLRHSLKFLSYTASICSVGIINAVVHILSFCYLVATHNACNGHTGVTNY